MKNPNRKNHGEGEIFHYINGDYSWGFSGVLEFLDAIDCPFPHEKGSPIYTCSDCLDKATVSSSV